MNFNFIDAFGPVLTSPEITPSFSMCNRGWPDPTYRPLLNCLQNCFQKCLELCDGRVCTAQS